MKITLHGGDPSEEYKKGCRTIYKALRYGPLAVQLSAKMTRYDLVLAPTGGVADHEDFAHDADGLYVMVTNFGAGMFLADGAAADSGYLSEKLRMRQGDTSSIAKLLRDVVRFSEEG